MMHTRFLSSITVLLLLLTAAVFSSCNCEDITTADTEWAQKPTNPVLTGKITTIAGAPLGSAEVTITLSADESYTVKSDSLGNYTIDNLKPGTFPTIATYPLATNYNEMSDNVVLANNKVTIWNVCLYPVSTETTKEETEEGAVYTITLPDVVKNDTVAETQIATYTVPSQALDADDELILSSWYDIDKAGTSSRATFKYTGSDVVVTVMSKSKSGATKTKKPIKVSVLDLVNPSKVVHNGKEVETTSVDDETGRYTYFGTTDLGETEFFYPIYKSEETTTQIPITFTPTEFGGYTTEVTTSFTSKVGTQVVFQNNFLDQYVAVMEGTTSAVDEQKTITIQKTIPAGEKAIISGYQNVTSFTYKCGWAEVHVKRYGDVYYTFKDRIHTGGSN